MTKTNAASGAVTLDIVIKSRYQMTGSGAICTDVEAQKFLCEAFE